MDKRQLYSQWAPHSGYVWTRFAKPALFMHVGDTPAAAGTFFRGSIPMAMQQCNDGKTAVVVNLMDASGVEAGIGLAKAGFRPVPLYNGVHETNNGGLAHTVDNTPIIQALASGVGILNGTFLRDTAPPAFLVDSGRDPVLSNTAGMYDNRWNLDVEDMPTASYMKEQGITRLIIWTDTDIQDDLKTILRGYFDAGMQIMQFANDQLTPLNGDFLRADDSMPEISTEIREAVRAFENARFGLLLAVILAGINLVGMFLVHEEPFLWTAPCIMWLTYLWVSESTGDIIALAMSFLYFVLYLSSRKKRGLLLTAFIIFGIDTAIYYIYVLYYGINEFTGHSLAYGAVVFIPPIIILFLLARGMLAYKQLETISDTDYRNAVNYFDGYDQGHYVPPSFFFTRYRGRTPRVHSNRYRGYRGYGGMGSGGYGSRGGYSGFGG